MNRRDSIRLLAPLAGAAVLVAVALSGLPWRDHPFARPRTPFDRSTAPGVAAGFAMLRNADGVIPRGAVVLVQTEPADATSETYFHRIAIALLPGRDVLPAAYYGVPTPPEIRNRASYVVVVGRKPEEPPGRLLLETPDGTVWKRNP